MNSLLFIIALSFFVVDVSRSNAFIMCDNVFSTRQRHRRHISKKELNNHLPVHSGNCILSLHSGVRSTALRMGFFDSIAKAFSNEQYSSPPEGIKATARHILVSTKEEANSILSKVGSTSFSSLASQYSKCPSGKQAGGSLGSFRPGTMVPEFDEVIFSQDTNIGEIVGPVQTQFGYHLIVVDKRTGI